MCWAHWTPCCAGQELQTQLRPSELDPQLPAEALGEGGHCPGWDWPGVPTCCMQSGARDATCVCPALAFPQALVWTDPSADDAVDRALRACMVKSTQKRLASLMKSESELLAGLGRAFRGRLARCLALKSWVTVLRHLPTLTSALPCPLQAQPMQARLLTRSIAPGLPLLQEAGTQDGIWGLRSGHGG